MGGGDQGLFMTLKERLKLFVFTANLRSILGLTIPRHSRAFLRIAGESETILHSEKVK
jgi:hypothetical protein